MPSVWAGHYSLLSWRVADRVTYEVPPRSYVELRDLYGQTPRDGSAEGLAGMTAHWQNSHSEAAEQGGLTVTRYFSQMTDDS